MTMKNKKSTPGGAPIPKQDYGTTSEKKSRAELRFGCIGNGPSGAVCRPRDPKDDREFRRLIAEANMSGECIIPGPSGYYRPGDDDSAEFNAYIAAERHRAHEILRKCRRMEETYNRRYQ